MPDPNLNALWCRAIAEEIKRAGVKYAVLCPGSRNSPLLHALHAQFGGAFELLEHLSESHQTPSGAVQQFVYCHCVMH